MMFTLLNDDDSTLFNKFEDYESSSILRSTSASHTVSRWLAHVTDDDRRCQSIYRRLYGIGNIEMMTYVGGSKWVKLEWHECGIRKINRLSRSILLVEPSTTLLNWSRLRLEGRKKIEKRRKKGVKKRNLVSKPWWNRRRKHGTSFWLRSGCL